MSEFIEFLSPSALSEMEKANAELVKMVVNVKSVQTEMAKINTPSGGDAAVKQLTAQYQEQAKAIKDLQTQVQKLTEAKQKQKTLSLEEKVVASQQLKIDKEAALAVSALTGAYQKLSLQRKQAATNLQNLIASEKASTAEIKKAQREYDILAAKVAKADQAIGKMSTGNSLKGLTSQVSNLVGAFGVSTGVYLFAQIAQDVYKTTKQLESLDLALKMVSGSTEIFASNQTFLSSLAEQYGIEIKSLTKNFTEFWVASKGKLEAEQIKAVFTSISKAGSLMGLSLEAQDSAFLALQQMMSKGTVQAEELKKQLGNALPGAIKAATMAYQALHPELKVTEKLFMEQMKAGKVISAELLPELAKQFEKLYGIENVNRADTLMAAQERLSNSWTNMIRAMNEGDTGGISQFFKIVIDGLTTITTLAGMLFKGESALQKQFQSIGAAKAADELNKYREQFKEYSDETKKFMDEEYLAKQRINIVEQQKIIKEQQELRKTLLGGNRAFLHLQTKIEEDALVSLGKSSKIIKIINEEKIKANKPLTPGTPPPKVTNEKTFKQINISDKILKKEFDYAIKILETAKKLHEEIFNNEEESYDRRLLARELYSKVSLDLIDTQNNREIAIEKDKAAQLLKNQQEARDKDLKTNAENIKNGFADKRVEIENRYAENVKTINYNLAQELYKIDVDYLDKTHELQNQDLAFFAKIQKEKEKLTKETADIYFQMAQDRRQKDANDENRSLTQRQASFESWKKMAEAQLFYDEAIAKANSNQSPEQIARITAEFDKLRQSINDTISPLQKFAEETKGWLSDFTSSFVSDAGFTQTFKILGDDFFANIDKAFNEGLISKEEKYAAYFNAITEMAQEAYNFLSQISQQNFDAEYSRLEQQKNIAIAFADDSTSAKEEIERQYEERRKQIARREAQAKKQQAIMNIAIDTAQAIMGLWVKPGFPAAIPMAIAVGALGATQIAMVASQQIPEYWKGTDNAKEGLAWTQEKGAEIITDKNGNIKTLGSNNGAQLTKLDKGDKVYTASQSAMMFNDNLNSMLLNNGISMPKVEINNNSALTESQVNSIVSAIKSKETVSMNIGKDGLNMYVRNGHTTKEIMNKRINFQGNKV